MTKKIAQKALKRLRMIEIVNLNPTTKVHQSKKYMKFRKRKHKSRGLNF